MKKHVKTRLMKKLSTPDEGCWEFGGKSKSTGGYGLIWVNGKYELTHRTMWRVCVSEIPAGKQIHHTCDKPSCCRPDHLWMGDQLDNMRDKISKGRSVVVKGEKQGGAKLTVKDVVAIRSLPMLHRELAEMFGVSQSAVSLIRNRKRWSHV